MAPTTPQHPLPTTPSRRHLSRLTDEDTAVLAIIRATLDEPSTPAFDLYDHLCRVLDGRERSI